jgi:hypothetical protein
MDPLLYIIKEGTIQKCLPSKCNQSDYILKVLKHDQAFAVYEFFTGNRFPLHSIKSQTLSQVFCLSLKDFKEALE